MPVKSNSYPGGKSGAGIYQRLINLIPRHRILTSPRPTEYACQVFEKAWNANTRRTYGIRLMRAQEKVRRILQLIDVLAPLRLPFTIQEAKHRLAEKSLERIKVCDRTIKRDLDLLVSMNFAYFYREPRLGSKLPALYKMNLRMTTHVELAAMHICGYTEA